MIRYSPQRLKIDNLPPIITTKNFNTREEAISHGIHDLKIKEEHISIREVNCEWKTEFDKIDDEDF